MRLNYYEFPEGVDPHTRYRNGASNKGGHCELGHTSCRECEGCWYECEHYHCDKAEPLICGCSVTTAKKLLKEFGGRAWTEHCDRSGGCFEVTPVQLGQPLQVQSPPVSLSAALHRKVAETLGALSAYKPHRIR